MAAPKIRAPKISEMSGLFAESIKRTAISPGITGYRPQEHQIPFHSSSVQGRMILGGNRSGKTVGGATESIYYLKGEHPYKKVRPAPVKGRGVSVDENDGLKKIMLPEIARWMPPSLLKNGSWEDSYEKGARILNLTNGSMMEFLTYEQDVQKHAGTSRHFVWFDEEPPEDIFNENMLRLLDTGGDWWLTMTPLIDMSWTYDRLFEPGIAGGRVELLDGSSVQSLEIFQVNVYQNAYVNKQQIEVLTSGLSEEEKLARIQGKYFSYSGAIYTDSLSPDNFIDPIHISDQWPIYYNRWGHFAMLDHGFTNPTAFYLGCFNAEGQIIIYYEYYQSGKVVKENAQAIFQIIKDLRLQNKIEYMVADPSIWNKDPITGTTIAQEYAENGLHFGRANNDVSGGINRVATRLKSRNERGVPLLLITNNCEKAKWEFSRYRWAKYDTAKAAAKNNPKETPHKKDDHAMDAIRYGVVSRPQLDNELPLSTGNVLNAPRAVDPEEGWHDPGIVYGFEKPSDDFDDYLGADF